jgi:hypothetical protein
MNTAPGPARTAVIPGVLTVVLGGCVAVAWFVFGGSASFRGPIRALEDSWPLIYGGQAVLAGLVGIVAARPLVARLGWGGAAAAVVAAWIGEWFALLVGGRLLAGELMPESSWFYWVIGTGGPLQPIAALVGLWLGSGRGRTPQAPMAEAISNRPS